MQVKKTQLAPTRVKLQFIGDQSTLEPVKNAAVIKLGQQLKVPGFRPGKAPSKVLEQQIDPARLQSEVIEQVINHYYSEAVNQEGLRPIEQPEVSITKFVPFSTLEFELEVETVGKITLPDYKKIRLAKDNARVTVADVNGVLNSLQTQMATRVSVDRPAKDGDQVTIDFKGTDAKGQPVNGADGSDYPLVLGSKSFIPGFEDKLLGTKTGAKTKFNLTFPKDYAVAALANKKVTFSVTVKDVQELTKPKLDDDFAAKAGPFKTLADLKTDIKQQVLQEKQQQLDRDYQNKLLQKIAAKSTVDIPPKLIDEQIEAAEKEERQNLVYKGQTWEEHLKAEGVTEAQHRQRNRPDAELRVKAGLVLSEVADQEGLSVSPEELEIRLQLLKGQYQDPAMQAELDKPENRRDIAMRMLSEKTIQRLTEYATKK